MINELFTISASIGTTEYSITNNSTTTATQTADGIVQVFVDLNALIAGDIFEFRAFEKCRSGDTQRVVFTTRFAELQTQPIWLSPMMTVMHGWDFMLKRIAGSDRTIAASVRGDDAMTVGSFTAGAIGSLAFAADGITRIQAGLATSAALTTVQADTDDIQTRLPAALIGGRMDANVGAISSDATAADNAEAFFDGTGYAGTNNVIPNVTTLTNLPAITANWLTAAGIAAGALNGKGDWLLASNVPTNFSAMLIGAAGSVTMNGGGLLALETTAQSVKTQTDKLTFTVANQLDVNIQYVNDVQVKGVGTAGDPWNPV